MSILAFPGLSQGLFVVLLCAQARWPVNVCGLRCPCLPTHKRSPGLQEHMSSFSMGFGDRHSGPHNVISTLPSEPSP